jgi:hypothetical protein|uniref:hypothetical protein n=1 Tax=Eubacterium sp. TaxID=142586 RepID=UPI003FF023E2
MPGRYMPFKEIFAYSFGGIGIYFLICCVQQLMLSTTNVIIGNAIGISPAVYEKVGINETTLKANANEIASITGKSISDVLNSPYNVLYINDIFKKAFIVVLSVIGATLNFIPYFFYDMTELCQRAIVKVLKLRAMF